MLIDRLSRAPAHRASTAQLQSVYPGISRGDTVGAGVCIGRHVHGGFFTYDPWELYASGALTNPNLLVLGQLGRGKSALVKCYVLRQLVFGRQALMLDPKGENGALCAAAGCTPMERCDSTPSTSAISTSAMPARACSSAFAFWPPSSAPRWAVRSAPRSASPSSWPPTPPRA